MSTRYCIWNNKGGVGKTFLTYSLAIEYAKKHPGENVVIFDLCPQANISAMLLGGDGVGEENLATLANHGRTIAGYIKQRNDGSKFSLTGLELKYFVKVSDYNKNMPENLYILPGDIDLDLCAQIIDYMSNDPRKGSWIKSRMIVSDLIDVFDKEHSNKKNVFFIDTNPSFSNYTHLGILAADRFVIPCTSDSFSLRGIYNIFRLVYGIKIIPGILADDDMFIDFSERVKETGHPLPKIHSLVLNRSRTFDKKASKAYMAHAEQIRSMIGTLSKQLKDSFAWIDDRTEFVYDMKDCNTISAVLNYTGIAPSGLRHQKYEVYGEMTQVNQDQITPYLENTSKIVADL